jgi:hypothetical protein
MRTFTIKALVQCLPILLFTSTFSALAQKLPTEQTISLRAPANIKIDGKADEWNNKFQAYNNHVEFFYTLSNDDQNLYLTIQAKLPDIIRHIINGGITFTINKSGKKNDKDGIGITYPLIKGLYLPLKNSTQGINIRVTGESPATDGDSLMNVTNKRMDNRSKEIRIKGIKDVDTLISVYNADGIKAAAAFDNKMVYTYELAMSLKNLAMSVQDASKFIYQLRINEVEQRGVTIKTNDGQPASASTDASHIVSVSIGPGAQMGQAATDFWGEYILKQ